ncbi:hypothetical protein [Methylobacterium sp. C1]|uniref:hypothetical protein n=1 Tax=Methylobacterium sp. C1 TaxID=1479019 RepID=UPI000D1E4E7D|nr:hypothetical protein [Methylobacterium sp. C1]
MCKKLLRDTQMATAEVVQSKERLSDLLRWESRGPGDLDNAMRRLSRRHGVEYGTLWSLRYRAPKRIWADVYTAIANAYAAEIERQRGKLEDAAIAAEPLLGADRASVRAARALSGRSEGTSPSLVDEDRQRLISVERRP